MYKVYYLKKNVGSAHVVQFITASYYSDYSLFGLNFGLDKFMSYVELCDNK